MDTVKAYKTTDGRLFEDASEALSHEFHLGFVEEFEEFFSGGHCSYQGTSPQGSMVRRAIVEWEIFKRIKEQEDEDSPNLSDN